MSEKILGGVLLFISLAGIWLARSFEAPFSYEPVGPRAFPMLILALLGISAIALMLEKKGAVTWAAPATLQGIGALFLIVLAYAWLFDKLGFIVANQASRSQARNPLVVPTTAAPDGTAVHRAWSPRGRGADPPLSLPVDQEGDDPGGVNVLNSAERADCLDHGAGSSGRRARNRPGPGGRRAVGEPEAADRFRDQLSEEARGVERAAGQLSQAAALLHRHARTLECLPPVVPPFLPVG